MSAPKMETYIGVKKIKATSMTRGKYNEYRGWDLPENEKPRERGYLVEYIDSEDSNHPNHEGYISWSPKKAFDDAYEFSNFNEENIAEALNILKEKDFNKTAPHEVRIVEEFTELTLRLGKLVLFIKSDKFAELEIVDRKLMNNQAKAMFCYLNILIERVKNI